MFPKGAPGIALLLLRIAVGVGVVEDRWISLNDSAPDWTLVAYGALALMLFIGLLTPLVCGVIAVSEIASWTLGGHPWQQIHLCILLIALALALLGPGAYSLDGLAFGRRRLIFPPGDQHRP